MALGAYAQQTPQYTQYVFNSFLLNPAVSGIENYTDMRLGNRIQWRGLPGAPDTRYFSIHAPVGKEFIYNNANSVSGQGENPMSRSFVQTYQAAPPHHGVGFSVITDQTGPLKRTDINLSYAYHLGISDQVNFSVGLSGGMSQVALDLSEVVLEDSGDALLFTNGKKSAPNLNAGFWIYGPRFFVGIAAHRLLGAEVRLVGSNAAVVDKQQPQVFASAGYKLFLSEDIALLPSCLLSYSALMPLSTDLNMKLAFRDKFWIGGGYRRNDSFSANAGFNVGYLFNLAYAYDFTTSRLNTVSQGTHELVLGIMLNNRYKVNCPQNNW